VPASRNFDDEFHRRLLPAVALADADAEANAVADAEANAVAAAVLARPKELVSTVFK
jgi:hypothetical protein